MQNKQALLALGFAFPMTRGSVEVLSSCFPLRDTAWHAFQDECESLDDALDKRRENGQSMNAFELMASALDISAIFDDRDSPSRATSTRFLSKEDPVVIVQCLERLATARDGRLIQSGKSR